MGPAAQGPPTLPGPRLLAECGGMKTVRAAPEGRRFPAPPLPPGGPVDLPRRGATVGRGLPRPPGAPRFTRVASSMGGPIAQLLWRHPPSRVEGLVLCAPSRNFQGDPRERL